MNFPRCTALFPLVLLACLLPAAVAHAQCGTPGSCIAVHSPGGCDSIDCCTTVCTLDPTCCMASWDSGCVGLANQSCVGYCGALASGSCYTPHANPACDTAVCCNAVCALDAFCCTDQWDITCTQMAGFACPGTPGTCGVTPQSCFTAHSQGACSDAVCCTAVCQIDSTCCSQSWDAICVQIATQTCVAGCVPTAEPNAATEMEACDERSNDPCYVTTTGVPEPMTANIQMKGKLGRSPSSANGGDADVYRITVPDPDGDGSAKVTLQFACSPTGWAALVADTACAPIASSLVHVSSNLCLDQASAAVCVPAGTYRIVVAAGSYPNFGGTDVTCVSGNAYTVKLTVAQTCSSCNANAGTCFAPHETPGCSSASCCAAVCTADPFCCDTQWDSSCVGTAANQCLTGPPANDACAGATVVTVGSVLLNTARSGLELNPPLLCGPASFARDVWCRYDADRSGPMEVQTCGTWFDTVLAVYSGKCGALVEVACNDDGSLCAGIGGSRASFTAVCGQRYYFRVGPKSGQGQGGELTLRLLAGTSVVCPQCPADLNHNGTVDAADITIVLSGWGGATGDITGDGVTNAQDIAAVLSAWGPCN